MKNITMRDLTWTFGDRVRKVRRAAGLSQDEFAELLGITKGSLAAWETGRNEIPREAVKIARTIAAVLGVPAAWTLGLDEVLELCTQCGHRPASSGGLCDSCVEADCVALVVATAGPLQQIDIDAADRQASLSEVRRRALDEAAASGGVVKLTGPNSICTPGGAM